MDPLIKILLFMFAALNVFTFLLYGWDKLNARSNAWRVSERQLWLFTLLGGSVGALAGMHVFRHKTQKSSFQFVIACILLLHVAIVVLVFRSFFAGR